MSAVKKCPVCEIGEMDETLQQQVFDLRVGPRPTDLVSLVAEDVPVMTCRHCGEQLTDWRGGRAQERAVAAYRKAARGE